MRTSLRYAIALAAVVALVGCNDSSKTGSARTAIAPAPAPAPGPAAEADLKCPPTPALKCPPAAGKASKVKAKASSPRHGARPSARRTVHAAHRHGSYRYAERAPEPRAARGLPPHPYSYDELTQDDHRRFERSPHDERIGLPGDRLERRGHHDRSSSYREGEVYERSERHDSYGDEGRYAERRHHHGRHDQAYERGEAWTGERQGYREESQSESSSYSERTTFHSSSASRRFERHGGPCCEREAPPQAAGFDSYGFLTWPGKVPARPMATAP